MVEQPVCESTEMERLVDEYGTGMLRMCCMYLGDVHLAQDAVQDAFIKIYRAWRPIENPAAEKAWVMRITVNVCKDVLRSPWRRRMVALDRCREPAFAAPEHQALYAEVMALPAKYRLPLYLYYYEGYQAREIAELTHRNLSTVQTWLMRARGQLQRSLKEAWSRNG